MPANHRVLQGSERSCDGTCHLQDEDLHARAGYPAARVPLGPSSCKRAPATPPNRASCCNSSALKTSAPRSLRQRHRTWRRLLKPGSACCSRRNQATPKAACISRTRAPAHCRNVVRKARHGRSHGDGEGAAQDGQGVLRLTDWQFECHRPRACQRHVWLTTESKERTFETSDGPLGSRYRSMATP